VIFTVSKAYSFTFWLRSWRFDVLVVADNLRSSVAVSKYGQSEQHKRKFLEKQQINKISECIRLTEVENVEPIAF
jgi:hypothetical protein